MPQNKLEINRIQGSEDSFPQLAEATIDGPITHRNCKILQANSAFARLFGYELSEIIGADIAQFIAEQSQELMMKNLASVNAAPCKVECLREDGATFEAEIYGRSTNHKEHQIQVIAVSDITGRSQSSNDLDTAQKLSYGIINAMQDGVTLHDSDGTLIYCNPAFCQMTGFSREEIVGLKPPRPYWPPEEYQEIRQAFETDLRGEAAGHELTLMRKNGERFPVISSPCWLKYGNTVAYFAIIKDISELKQLRENKQFYISETIRAQEAERKHIARDLHDDTLQSLATLCLNIEAVGRNNGRSSGEVTEQLEQLRNSIQGIMQGVRRFCHELRPDVLDRLGLVAGIELLAGELNKQMGINTCVEITGEQRRLLAETKLVLFRIAQEALHNIARHSQATEVLVRLDFRPCEVELTITDNGKGFKVPKLISHMASEGKLGLINMQERARLLGAYFSITSQKCKGTKVSVTKGQ